MKVINAILIISLVLLASCDVAKPAIPTKKPFRFQKDFTKNGLILGSITFPKEKPLFDGYFIYLINLDENPKKAKKNSEQIQISPELVDFKMRHAGQLDTGRTYLFALETPVGNYKFSGIRFYNNSGYRITEHSLGPDAFSIPFNVEQGEIIYVGTIIFNEYGPENGLKVDHQNNYDRDIEAIKKVIPTVDWNTTKNDTTIKLVNPSKI